MGLWGKTIPTMRIYGKGKWDSGELGNELGGKGSWWLG
jgi:hypothetical protein